MSRFTLPRPDRWAATRPRGGRRHMTESRTTGMPAPRPGSEVAAETLGLARARRSSALLVRQCPRCQHLHLTGSWPGVRRPSPDGAAHGVPPLVLALVAA